MRLRGPRHAIASSPGSPERGTKPVRLFVMMSCKKNSKFDRPSTLDLAHGFEPFTQREVSPVIRACLIASSIMIIGAAAPIARAADGWTYTVIATNVSPRTETSYAINDLGHVVYAGRELLPGGQEREVIRKWNGVTTTTLAESAPYTPNVDPPPFGVARLDVNNSGQVIFHSGNPPTGLFRLDAGNAVAVESGPYDASGHRGSNNAVLNDSNQTVFQAVAGGISTFFGIRVVTERPGATLTDTHVYAPFSPTSVSSRGPTINDHGDTAINVVEQISSTNRVRFRLARRDTGAIEDSILVTGSGARVFSYAALNDLRFGASVVSDGELSPKRALMVVPQDGSGVAGIVEVARAGSGGVLSLGNGIAISNTNLVAFSGVRADASGVAREFIAVKDAGVEPVIVVSSGDTLGPGGPLIDLHGSVSGEGFLHMQALNTRGEMVFYARVGGVDSFVRATPLPGVVSGNPILPPPEDILPDEGWRFAACPGLSEGLPGGGRRCIAGIAGPAYFDPPVASGYLFTSEDATLRFSSVVVPAPLPGGDASFNVEFNGGSQPLVAGVQFDFETFVPGGVSAFRITGIDLAEGLDPEDPAAFVTGLTFAPGAAEDATFTMVPIVENTDDFDGDGVIASQDNCPLDFNVDQADGDGDGVGNVCDNCPSTANPSQADSDGDGEGDACETVVARVCSVDADGDIDRDDIALITAARNRPASGANDPRDVDLNGIINVNDARACTLRCDRAACAAQ